MGETRKPWEVTHIHFHSSHPAVIGKLFSCYGEAVFRETVENILSLMDHSQSSCITSAG